MARKIEFASDQEIQRIRPLIDELIEHVLSPDEEPLFISDEATILDVSGESPEALLKRCSDFYHASLSHEDLRLPLWQLLLKLRGGPETAIEE